MKNLVLATWLILSAINLSPCFAQGNEKADAKPLSPLEQTLIANEKSLLEAQKKKDADFFKRTLADDFLEVSIDGKVRDRQEILGALLEITLKEFRSYNFAVLPVADNVAIVTYDAIMQMTTGDDEMRIPRYQHLSSVWVKQGEQWKLKFQQATAAL